MANANSDLVKASYIEYLAKEEEQRQANYVAYRNYYNGEQKTQITARMRKFLELDSDQEFCANYCALVVDALNERLHVTGFMSDDDAVDKAIAEILKANRFDALQVMLHLQGLIDGDAYVMVDWDAEKGMPTLTMQYAYTDSSVGGTADGVKMHYSDEEVGKALFASKRWLVTKGEGTGTTRYANLYYPDRVQKWKSETGEIDWNVYQELWWANPKTHEPLGIPLFHFPNRLGAIGNFGESEMRRALPLQDLLNKTVIDLIGGMDNAGFPAAWLFGVNQEQIASLSIHPGGIIAISDSNARVEWHTPQALSQLQAMAEYVSMEIARVTDTPVSRFQTTAQRGSAATLQQEERGLVQKAEHRQVIFGNAWEDALMFALKLMRTFGGVELPDPLPMLSCQWQPAATPDVAGDTVRAEKMIAAGIPLEYVAKKIWGLSEDEWASIEEMKTREEARTGNVGAVLMRNFEKGLMGNAQPAALAAPVTQE